MGFWVIYSVLTGWLCWSYLSHFSYGAVWAITAFWFEVLGTRPLAVARCIHPCSLYQVAVANMQTLQTSFLSWPGSCQ
ncbi:hypothetical protein QBC37DRAFT_427717 [Rhypophila decipiens]|uniref:Uncharacterized protein n=1 Tax=Rhypophila decipiens TaxID=261697 RepID=A0AAN6Y4C3_9PEZI|nr:hypothetical protein QBC37DRAFT_427717 [Rhypophila decipiens]